MNELIHFLTIILLIRLFILFSISILFLDRKTETNQWKFIEKKNNRNIKKYTKYLSISFNNCLV